MRGLLSATGAEVDPSSGRVRFPEALAAEPIDQVGPGGLFTDREHTARHFRREQWERRLWSRQMVQGWLVGDRKIDAERGPGEAASPCAQRQPGRRESRRDPIGWQGVPASRA